MAKLTDQIKIALDEARTLVLGAQVLLGFEYQAVFETRFERFPFAAQCLKLGSLVLLLLALALLLAPTAYHRIVEEGRSSAKLRRFVTTTVSWAVLPFALALGGDFSLAFLQVCGARAAVLGGLVSAAVALFFWYGIGFGHRIRRTPEHGGENEMEPEREERAEETPLKDKVEHALTETRVVLPGAQALLGFQFAAMLMDGFEKLPQSAVTVHLASLALTALAIVFLITPAAYHRIAERGENTEHFHRIAGRMIILAMAVLAPGVCGDLWVVMLKVTHSYTLSTVSAGIMLAVFYSLWFAFTFWKRSRERHVVHLAPAPERASQAR